MLSSYLCIPLAGLGLATVEALVRQLDGEVRLENRLDRPGLVAIVTLPVAPGLSGHRLVNHQEGWDADGGLARR